MSATTDSSLEMAVSFFEKDTKTSKAEIPRTPHLLPIRHKAIRIQIMAKKGILILELLLRPIEAIRIQIKATKEILILTLPI